MTVVANTLNTYDVKGIREDLEDIIYNISPEDTPWMNSVGRTSASQTLHEWQVDTLAATDTANAQLEGDDITAFAAAAATTRLGNNVQISRKLAIVSGTNDAVNSAGRKQELAYQIAKRGKELKRDMEAIALSVQIAVNGATATARKTGSFISFLKSNTDKGGSGVDPVYTTLPNNARTDGTQRAFTETILKNVIALAWGNGGKPSILMVGSGNKQVVSGFAGVYTKTLYQQKAGPGAIVGAADVYVSDFGQISVVPNRFQRNRDGLLIDPEYASVMFLRKFQTIALAKTGDAEKRMLLVEWGVKVHNEAAHGICADLS